MSLTEFATTFVEVRDYKACCCELCEQPYMSLTEFATTFDSPKGTSSLRSQRATTIAEFATTGSQAIVAANCVSSEESCRSRSSRLQYTKIYNSCRSHSSRLQLLSSRLQLLCSRLHFTGRATTVGIKKGCEGRILLNLLTYYSAHFINFEAFWCCSIY